MNRAALSCLLLAFSWSPCPTPAGAAPAADDVLAGLRPKHPRLYVTDDQLAAVKKAIDTDPVARGYFDKLKAEADKTLKSKPVEHVLIGPRLLDKSRTALGRVSTLAGLYRLTGDKRYAERARAEMLAVAAFADWNPSHFLDVAEMTNATAVGYDWLFDFLSPADRATIRRAIVEMGLKPGLKIYDDHRWWAVAKHNWNQVCNGGMTSGALAVADEEPDVARRVVAAARESIPLAMASFAPDGGWAEGPGYWNYATAYNVYYLSAVETALGTDFGLKRSPGFGETGEFRIDCLGPTGLTFNYADAGADPGRSAQMFWLARTFDRPAWDAFERRLVGDRPGIFHLLWFNPQYSTPQAAEALQKLPPSRAFRGIDVAFLRSDWADNRAAFVGFKGGDNKANHSHLDLGTFVLDAAGERWAVDLGGDDYNLPDYFGKKRWTYYRLRTEGHNTLTLDGENQQPDGKAPLLAFSPGTGDVPGGGKVGGKTDGGSAGERAFAVADLTGGYRTKARKVLRGIALTGRHEVLVQDEVEAADPVAVIWNFHTPAKIALAGATATLTLHKAELTARILSPAGATFETIDANPPPPQRQQPDVKNLTVRLPGKVTRARIVVAFAPAGEPPAGREAATIRPLDEWVKAAPLTKP